MFANVNGTIWEDTDSIITAQNNKIKKYIRNSLGPANIPTYPTLHHPNYTVEHLDTTNHKER